ncbi:hypothetical protein ACFLZI_01660 [Nitrospirota bacterium]
MRYNVTMEFNGVIPGRGKGKLTLRITSSEPYSAEFTATQIGVLADIAEEYGSGQVHVTPRQTVEIPHVDETHLGDITSTLTLNDLALGSAGSYLRNVTACSRWCLYNAFPLSDTAQRLNAKYIELQLPGKTNISLSGCDFSCVRSRTSDIGVIARADIELTDKKCKQCKLCVKEPLGCQVDAITLTEDGVTIDQQKCVRCGFCSNVCKPDTIIMKASGFDVFVGGNGGVKSREAKLYRSVNAEDELMDLIDEILTRYPMSALEGERIGDVIERVGFKGIGG